MNLELKEGLGCWGYIQRKLTYLGSSRARCCLLSTSCTPSTLHTKPLFVTFLQRKQHHRFMVEGKTGFGKVTDVPSSRSLLIKEAEWCGSLEALKGEPLDVDTLSMGFWDLHLRKLLSFCACSISSSVKGVASAALGSMKTSWATLHPMRDTQKALSGCSGYYHCYYHCYCSSHFRGDVGWATVHTQLTKASFQSEELPGCELGFEL